MNRIKIALVAGSAFLAIGGLAWAQAEHGHPAPPVVSFSGKAEAVPFELFRGNRIFVPATFNGRETQVMLDTGASATTVDRAYARSIGLPEGQKIRALGAGGTVDAEIVSGVSMQVGGMRFDKMTVAVMDLAPISRAIGRPLNIVLGREFFNSAVISIDWASNTLKATPHDGFQAAKGSTEVALGRNGPFNTIPVSVGGSGKFDALLDLGNGGTLILTPTIWRDRPELNSLRHADTMMGGVGGLHGARAATVPQVTLAGRSFSGVPTVLAEQGDDHQPTQMSNVGIGFLKQFHLDLDLGRNRIYMTPRNDSPPFERDRSGTRLELVGDRLKVTFVSPQGPAAAAGLKQGDEIVAIDGHQVSADYYKGRDWARGPAGTSVVLQRPDGSSVTVTLQDYF